MLSYPEYSDPKRAVELGVGLASPLWGAFMLTAGAGMAFWAWSRWARTGEIVGFGEAAAAPRDPHPAPVAGVFTLAGPRPLDEPASFAPEPEPAPPPAEAPRPKAAKPAAAPAPSETKPARAARAPSVRKPDAARAKAAPKARPRK